MKCDFWGSYESTTNIEAWLAGKLTFKFKPSLKLDKDQAELKDGNFEFSSYSTLSKFINWKLDHVDLTRLNEQRTRLIEDTIGHSDGRSHIRAAQEISNSVLSIGSYPCYSSFQIYKYTNPKLTLKLLINKIPFLEIY